MGNNKTDIFVMAIWRNMKFTDPRKMGQRSAYAPEGGVVRFPPPTFRFY